MNLPIKFTEAAILTEQNKELIVDYVDLPHELEIGSGLG